MALDCNATWIRTLNVKNGNRCWCNPSETENWRLNFSSCNLLEYICADEEDVPYVQQHITVFGLTNCHVNTYCSFTPGGAFYTINGMGRYDETNNGCDASDISFPNLKIDIDNINTDGGLISDTSGNYFYDVQAGAYTISPQLENPSYFNVSPSTTVTVNFPSQASPFTQDYCLAPNGIHNDLEVVIFPLNSARPGLDARYKIKYKNKGTHTQTATLNFNFDDIVTDFVTASTVPASQTTGNLSWSIAGLRPFQSGEITVTLNLNSPQETPGLMGGEHLNFTTSFNSTNADETPTDNTFTLPQTVVNSLDPNDKICLEGATISPAMVGQYVHYMIRFENTGTYNAENVVLADLIDAAKFDISSLQMVGSSHNCYTRIAGNKVEFIFENMNLPFDDANNDGWVVFKIKTLPSLLLNSTFSNTANIFFDYNAPIVTNTAMTTIAQLSNTDFDVSGIVTITPNPVKSFITLNTNGMVQLSSACIYNTLGQQVLTVTNPLNSIDVSQLKSGSYLIRFTSDLGVSTVKFIKE